MRFPCGLFSELERMLDQSGGKFPRLIFFARNGFCQTCWFGNENPPRQRLVRAVCLINGKAAGSLNGAHRSGRHFDKMKRPSQRLLRPGVSAIAFDRLERLSKRFRAMSFVQKDERVIGDQSGVHGPRMFADPVASEEQPRANLIDRTGDDGGLQWRAKPALVAKSAAPELISVQSSFAPR